MRLRLVLPALLAPALATAQPTTTTLKPGSLPAAIALTKKQTVLEAKGFLGVIGQTISPEATLKAKGDGKAIAGKRVSFTIAGKPAGSAQTTASGEAKISYHVPNDPPPGTMPVEIHFVGDEEWMPATAAVTLGVFKASTRLTLTPLTDVREGQKVTLQGKLVRTSDGDGVDGRAVSLMIDGKPKATPATGGSGFQYAYDVPAGAAPRFVVEAQFEGDTLYAASHARLEVLVGAPKKKGTFRWFGARGHYGDTVTVKGILLPQNPMLTVNGQAGGLGVGWFVGRDSRVQPPAVPFKHVCDATTAPDGTATCSIKLDQPVLSYILDAHTDRNGDWDVTEAGNYDDMLTVDPAPVRLAVTAPPSAHIGDTVPIKVRLTRKGDGVAISGATVSVEFGGSATTNASGDATVSVTISSSGGIGARTMKARYGGDPTRYQAGEEAFSMQVQPSVK